MKRIMIEALLKDVNQYNSEPNNIIKCDFCIKMFDYMAF